MGISCGSHRIWVRNVARTSGSSRVNRGSKQIMAGEKPKRTTPTVCIVESLDFLQEDSLKEGEIISRTLPVGEARALHLFALIGRNEGFCKGVRAVATSISSC